MKSILDLGKTGAETIDVAAPAPNVSLDGYKVLHEILGSRRFQTRILQDVEASDGIRHNVPALALALKGIDALRPSPIFSLVHQLSIYEPMVFAKKAGRLPVMGMLSPNYSPDGSGRMDSIKVLPLKQESPLVGRAHSFLPSDEAMIMLAGSAHAEGEGIGSHEQPFGLDYEHKLAALGAVSLAASSLKTIGGEHAQHAFRRNGWSTSHALTNGSLGNLYTPNSDLDRPFAGYGMPIVYEAGALKADDVIYIPMSFLDNPEQSLGISFPDASEITYGAGAQPLYNELGHQAVADRTRLILEAA